MEITVDKKDIKKGVKNECDLCPITWALSKIKGITNIYTYQNNIQFEYRNKSYKRKLPKIAREFILDYDLNLFSGIKVKPFSFNIRKV